MTIANAEIKVMKMTDQKLRRSAGSLNLDASVISFCFSMSLCCWFKFMPTLHKLLSGLTWIKRADDKFIRRLNAPENGPLGIVVNKQVTALCGQHDEVSLFDYRTHGFGKAKLLAD